MAKKKRILPLILAAVLAVSGLAGSIADTSEVEASDYFEDNLILNYDFEKQSGSTIEDVSGNGNDAKNLLKP